MFYNQQFPKDDLLKLNSFDMMDSPHSKIIIPVRKTYLATLGLNEGADQQKIKTAFRRLAAVYHPDKNPTERDRFIEICHAYDQLMAPSETIQVKQNDNVNRRIGRRGEPTNRRFEILLEQQYKGVNVSIKA